MALERAAACRHEQASNKLIVDVRPDVRLGARMVVSRLVLRGVQPRGLGARPPLPRTLPISLVRRTKEPLKRCNGGAAPQRDTSRISRARPNREVGGS